MCSQTQTTRYRCWYGPMISRAAIERNWSRWFSIVTHDEIRVLSFAFPVRSAHSRSFTGLSYWHENLANLNCFIFITCEKSSKFVFHRIELKENWTRAGKTEQCIWTVYLRTNSNVITHFRFLMVSLYLFTSFNFVFLQQRNKVETKKLIVCLKALMTCCCWKT